MNWLENMVLQSKLIFLTALMVMSMAILAVMGFNATSNWQDDIVEIGEIRVPSLVSIGTVRNAIQNVIIQQNRVRGIKGHPQFYEILKEISENMQTGFERMEKGIAIYSPLQQTPEEAIEWKKFEKNYLQWREKSLAFKINVIDALMKTTDKEEINLSFQKMTAFIETIRIMRSDMFISLQAVYDINKQVVTDTNKNAKEKSTSFNQMFIVVSVVSILFAIILAWLLIKSITRSITQSVMAIRDGAMQITTASEQVASAASSLAQGASEQASSIEEVSATIEENVSLNAQNTENARAADILAKHANESAKSGYEKGEQLSSSMHDITASATKISGIIKIIDEIAFQTNLLALNAAVEAARAGEHGLGFAVVADEVRTLAKRTATAAKETSFIIEKVVEEIKEGNNIALTTHTSFKEIVEQSKKVSDLITEISIAGKEQNNGMVQINQTMAEVDQVTQQVATNSEESAAAAEELSAQATAMMETINILAQIVGMQFNDKPRKTSKMY